MKHYLLATYMSMYGMHQKTLLLLFNNISLTVHDPFPIRLCPCIFSVRFESVLIYFRAAQSVLARGSLMYAADPYTKYAHGV